MFVERYKKHAARWPRRMFRRAQIKKTGLGSGVLSHDVFLLLLVDLNIAPDQSLRSVRVTRRRNAEFVRSPRLAAVVHIDREGLGSGASSTGNRSRSLELLVLVFIFVTHPVLLLRY